MKVLQWLILFLSGRCINCVDQKKGCCCYCNKKLEIRIFHIITDPCSKEIHGDYDLHLLCDDCYDERLYDI